MSYEEQLVLFDKYGHLYSKPEKSQSLTSVLRVTGVSVSHVEEDSPKPENDTESVIQPTGNPTSEDL